MRKSKRSKMLTLLLGFSLVLHLFPILVIASTDDEFHVFINFSETGGEPVDGYLTDVGEVYGDRGNGYTYGWYYDHTDRGRDHLLRYPGYDGPGTLVPIELYSPKTLATCPGSFVSRTTDRVEQTLMHFASDGVWEMDVPDGEYVVSIIVGDAMNGVNTSGYGQTLFVEDVQFFDNVLMKENEFHTVTDIVTVEDGVLSLAVNLEDPDIPHNASKINAIEIRAVGEGEEDGPVAEQSSSMIVNQMEHASSQVMATTAAEPAEEDEQLADSIHINFSEAAGEPVAGYLSDVGEVFADRDNGYSYGWNFDHTDQGRDHLLRHPGDTEPGHLLPFVLTKPRSASECEGSFSDTRTTDRVEQTLMQIKKDGIWEIELPNGEYEVKVLSGDAMFGIGNKSYGQTLFVEGVQFFDNVLMEENEFHTVTDTVLVEDGRLSLEVYLEDPSIPDRVSKINSITITPVEPEIELPPVMGLTVTADEEKVELTWEETAEAASYNVHRSTTSGAPYEAVQQHVTETVYTDATLEHETTYYYVVAAVDAGGNEGPPSEEVSIMLEAKEDDDEEEEEEPTVPRPDPVPGQPTPSPSPRPTDPGTTPSEPETRDVVLGGTDESVSVSVNREESDGVKTDRVVISADSIAKAIEKAVEHEDAAISLTLTANEEDPADEYVIELDEEAIKLLAEADLAINLLTDLAGVSLSADSLSEIEAGEDVSFRFAPVDDASEVEDRVAGSAEFKASVQDNDYDFVGHPVIVESSLADVAAVVTVPVEESITDDSRLRVFVEHSDGDNVARTGEAVYDDEGNVIGIAVSVPKFSTFTAFELKDPPAAPEPVVVEYAPYVNGYPEDGTFRPSKTLTRAELAAIIAQNIPESATGASFSDVPSDHWAKAYIEKLNGLGIMTGGADNTFRPNDPITRAEFATVLSRWLNLPTTGQTSFADVEGHWAQHGVAAVEAQGWMSGYEDGTFGPNRELTRAEAVRTLHHAMDRPALPDVTSSSWPDVSNDHWALIEIESASKAYKATYHSDGTVQVELD